MYINLELDEQKDERDFDVYSVEECDPNNLFIFDLNGSFVLTSAYSRIAFFTAVSCCRAPNCFIKESISNISHRYTIFEFLKIYSNHAKWGVYIKYNQQMLRYQ